MLILTRRVGETLMIGDEVTVKRYMKTARGIELLPENPDFSPILVSDNEPDFALEGLAVGLLRSW